jgi:hypothetical protein
MAREIRQANELCQGKKEFSFETSQSEIRAHSAENSPKEFIDLLRISEQSQPFQEFLEPISLACRFQSTIASATLSGSDTEFRGEHFNFHPRYR